MQYSGVIDYWSVTSACYYSSRIVACSTEDHMYKVVPIDPSSEMGYLLFCALQVPTNEA